MRLPTEAIYGTREERNRFAILQLQRYLRRLVNPNLTASGRMDEGTIEAIRAFQAERGLAESGIADLDTWEAIVQDGEQAILEDSDPLPLILPPLLFPPRGLSRGDTGEVVTLVQIMLNRFLLTLPNTAPLHSDGIYGPSTAEAVRLFRRAHALSEGEQTTKQVWNLLTAFYRAPSTAE